MGVHLQTLISTVISTMQNHHRRPNKFSKFSRNSRYKTSLYEKSTFTYLGQRHTKIKSPVQTKARAVNRKYKLQLRQLEFKRLKQIVPAMQNDNTTNDESDEKIKKTTKGAKKKKKKKKKK